jgi:hypothetical protein
LVNEKVALANSYLIAHPAVSPDLLLEINEELTL